MIKVTDSLERRAILGVKRSLFLDVCVENRRRPHENVCFPAASAMGISFLISEHPGIRVGNVCKKLRQKNVFILRFLL